MEIDLNEENDKIVNSCPLPLSKGKRKHGEGGENGVLHRKLGSHF